MNKQDSIAVEFAETVKALTKIHIDKEAEAKTETPIADIPTALTLEASEQWKAIRKTQLIQRLTEFRVQVEAEAGIAVANIPTSLGLALADMAEGLGIKEPLDLMNVLGADTYLAIYKDPIPYQLPEPWYITVRDLLTKLRKTWRGRWGGETEPEVDPDDVTAVSPPLQLPAK